MWCDDFDMDLPKVVPMARDALGAIGDLELHTYGHVTNGKLNHPSVWNSNVGSVAFFGRPGRVGKPASYYTNSPLVPCTLWEALRDAWCHDIVILFEGTPVWGDTWRQFEKLMWHTRGWRKLPEESADALRVEILDRIVACGEDVQKVIDRVDATTSTRGLDK